LAGLKKLYTLTLRGTRVTGTGLKDLTGLEDVFLEDAPVSDAGLKGLAGLTSLQWLSLNRTHVTDQGLRELAGLSALKNLELEGTGVTAAGVAALKRKLPGLTISWGDQP
jgi:hypothetical protein